MVQGGNCRIGVSFKPWVHRELKFVYLVCVCVFIRLEKSNKMGATLGDMSRKCAEKAIHRSLYHAGQVRHEHYMHSFFKKLYI